MGPRPAAEPAGGRSDPRRAPGRPRGGCRGIAVDLDGYGLRVPQTKRS